MTDLGTLGGTMGGTGVLSMIGIGTPEAILGASALNATIAWKNTTRNIEAQKERDQRLAELQERFRLEDKAFQVELERRRERMQLHRDETQREFTQKLEAQRMSFQEHLELRRLQFQARMEERREEFQLALTKMQQEYGREIAQFQAQAMRETQILVARENAKNMLENQMILEALKTFPLNISPLVLLNSRPNSLSSLMRFAVGDVEVLHEQDRENTRVKLLEANPIDVLHDIVSYEKHPEALNIFIAPVFVDSRVAFQKELSTKIWEATYQKIESFFTQNYSRDSKTPVVFYPTAWNDKYTSGVHASETLHFFLKDIPCIVLEPKFDGNVFRIAVSFWGLGYSSTEHHRKECEFKLNIDVEIAKAAYIRSQKALGVLDSIIDCDIFTDSEKRQKYMPLEHVLSKNIKIFEKLKLDKIEEMSNEERNAIIDNISALGLNNLFSVDKQDLEPISKFFASEIGATLAMLADLHHFVSTNADPHLPKLMSEGYFKEIYTNKEVCEVLSRNYREVIIAIKNIEQSMADEKQIGIIETTRQAQITNIQTMLNVDDILRKSWREQVSEYVKSRFGMQQADFEKVWNFFISNIDKPDLNFMKTILPQVDDEEKHYSLSKRIDSFS